MRVLGSNWEGWRRPEAPGDACWAVNFKPKKMPISAIVLYKLYVVGGNTVHVLIGIADSKWKVE